MIKSTRPIKRARPHIKRRLVRRPTQRPPAFIKKRFYSMVKAGAFDKAVLYWLEVVDNGTETESAKAWELFKLMWVKFFG